MICQHGEIGEFRHVMAGGGQHESSLGTFFSAGSFLSGAWCRLCCSERGGGTLPVSLSTFYGVLVTSGPFGSGSMSLMKPSSASWRSSDYLLDGEVLLRKGGHLDAALTGQVSDTISEGSWLR